MDMKEKIEIYREMQNKIEELCDLHNSLILRSPGVVIKFKLEGDVIEYTTEYWHCSSCGSDSDEGYIPIEYLWDEDWVEHAKAKKEADEAEQKRKAEADKARREKEAEERKYKEYLALKDKFEK